MLQYTLYVLKKRNCTYLQHHLSVWVSKNLDVFKTVNTDQKLFIFCIDISSIALSVYFCIANKDSNIKYVEIFRGPRSRNHSCSTCTKRKVFYTFCIPTDFVSTFFPGEKGVSIKSKLYLTKTAEAGYFRRFGYFADTLRLVHSATEFLSAKKNQHGWWWVKCKMRVSVQCFIFKMWFCTRNNSIPCSRFELLIIAFWTASSPTIFVLFTYLDAVTGIFLVYLRFSDRDCLGDFIVFVGLVPRDLFEKVKNGS